MLFNHHICAAATLFSALASTLPLDNRDIMARSKTYAVVNVGGSPQVPATTVVRATKTVEIVKPGPTVEVTATATATVNPSAPASTSSAAECTSSTASVASISSAPSNTLATAVQTPQPIYVTVAVAADDGPYYDDGLWHTTYRVKTWDAAAMVTPLAPAPSATVLPVLATAC